MVLFFLGSNLILQTGLSLYVLASLLPVQLYVQLAFRVLGPILFTVYISPIATIAASHNVIQQQYADDTQLLISLSPSSLSTAILRLETCLHDLPSWFLHNGLALNPDKSDAILFST